MTPIRDIVNAFAPESLARFPHLPVSHRKTFSAIRHCRRGHYGHSLYHCSRCGHHHRVNHSCGHRHWPQCPQPTTRQWLHQPLAKQLPGPHVLLTFTVPEALRPFIRSHQRRAYAAMCNASAEALKRLAKDARFVGTEIPAFTAVLHTWGRQLQSHPHLHPIVPGGGLAKDRPEWLPSRANVFVPVTALSPIYRAVFKAHRTRAGLVEHIAPQGWNLPWNVHSQAKPYGHTALAYLAPYVFTVALSNRRLVSLQDRTGTFTSRKPGSVRPRTTRLNAIEFIRRFLQHGLPDGFMQGRHFGLLHARCAMQTDTLRTMILQAPPGALKAPLVETPAPGVAACPPCGEPMRRVMRLWTADRALRDTA